MIPLLDSEISVRRYPSLTYAITDGGISGKCDGAEAMRQSIKLMLNTERASWAIYSTNYGSDVKKLIGENISYAKITLKRYITNCLLTDDRIKSVDGFEFESDGRKLMARFTVHTIFGDMEEEL